MWRALGTELRFTLQRSDGLGQFSPLFCACLTCMEKRRNALGFVHCVAGDRTNSAPKRLRKDRTSGGQKFLDSWKRGLRVLEEIES